jgi:hypothetical protein
MSVDINLHRVTNVIVQQHTHDRADGERWFVTKDIIVIDKNGNEILKLSLFGESVEDLRFQSQAEYDGIIETPTLELREV